MLLTVLLMDLGRFSSRTGPRSSSASPKPKDTMRGSLKSRCACWGGRWSMTEKGEEKKKVVGIKVERRQRR